MDQPLVYRPSSLDIGILCTSSDSYAHIRYPHCHPDYELTVVIDGVHEVALRDESLHLGPGELLLLRPDEVHTRRLVTPGKYIMVAFPAQEFELTVNFLGDDASGRLLLQESPPMALLSQPQIDLFTLQVERLNLFCTTNPKYALTELRALLVMLCTYYWKTSDSDMSGNAPWLTKLMLEMKKTDNMRRGLPAMLELVPYTHEYLCREFKRMIGCTPTEYINSIRLNHARKLLDDPNNSILDACYSAGYDSVSYFYHLFRAKFGTTPSRYRKGKSIAYPDVPQEQSSLEA